MVTLYDFLLADTHKDVVRLISSELGAPDHSRSLWAYWRQAQKRKGALLCVHSDTVNFYPPYLDVSGRKLKAFQSPLGADDRAGIWIAVQINIPCNCCYLSTDQCIALVSISQKKSSSKSSG